MLTRRQFIAAGAVAGVGVLTAGVPSGLAAAERTMSESERMKSWNGSTGIDRLMLAGTLAASSHNTQPWYFRASEEYLDLVGDSDRLMGLADSRHREFYLSLGCALENTVLAAADSGVGVIIEESLASDSRAPYLRARFVAEGQTADPRLAAAIPLRQTNRGPFDTTRGVPTRVLRELEVLSGEGARVTWLTSEEDRARFTQLSVDATLAHVADTELQRDSHRWYRMRRSDAEQSRDGITVASANLSAPASLLLGLFPPSSDVFDDGWETATRDTHCGTAPAFGIVTVEAGDPSAWIMAGRSYQRLQLAATLEGIGVHPISQALTMRDRELAEGAGGRFASGLDGLGGAGEVALVFRIGYPLRTQPMSLRRDPVIKTT